MHALFQLSLYTGQQLVLEGLHRWLQRPCQDEQQHRARRTSLKSLVVLLAKTAATGVLATVLDAAIEYRRRQVLAAAAAGDGDPESASRLASLGMLSRAGISALKTRLLLGIDELERRAEAFGIEGRHYGGKPSDAGASAGSPGKKGVGASTAGLPSSLSTAALGDEAKEERQRVLARTVEQLRCLVQDEGEDAEDLLCTEVDTLLDTLLAQPSARHAAPLAAAAAPSTPAGNSSSTAGNNVSTAALPAWPDELEEVVSQAACACAEAPATLVAAVPAQAAGTCASSEQPTTCAICMDRHVKVQVEGCKHEFCFQCARRLCDTQDHLVPHCPFCRQTIGGFAAC